MSDPGGSGTAHRARSCIFAGRGGARRICDIEESSVHSLLASRSPRLKQCKSVKENLVAFPVCLGRVFSSLVANRSGGIGKERPGLHNTCFPTYRQTNPSRTGGRLAASDFLTASLPITPLQYCSFSFGPVCLLPSCITRIL